MKTTIDLADDLVLRVKELARRQNRSMKEIFEEALRRLFKDREPGRSRPNRIKPIVYGSGGLTDEGKRLGWAGILNEANERDET